MVVIPLLIDLSVWLIPLILAVLLWTVRSWAGPIFQVIAASSQEIRHQKGLWGWIRKNASKLFWWQPLPALYKWLGKKVAATFKDVEHHLAARIASAAAQGIAATARYLHGWADLGHRIAEHLEVQARETYRALHHLAHVTLPAYVDSVADGAEAVLEKAGVETKTGAKAVFRTLATEAVRARATADALDDLLIRARQGIDSVLRDIPGIGTEPFADTLIDWAKAFGQLWGEAYDAIFPKVNDLWDNYRIDWNRRIRALEDDVFGTAAAGIDALRKAVRGLEDFTNNVGDVLTNAVLGSLATAAGLVGLAALLERLIPELMCKNTRNVGKRLCGLDAALLEEILGLSLALLVVVDPVKIAEAALVAEETIEPVIREVAA